jgi:hypothetical protein
MVKTYAAFPHLNQVCSISRSVSHESKQPLCPYIRRLIGLWSRRDRTIYLCSEFRWSRFAKPPYHVRQILAFRINTHLRYRSCHRNGAC